MTRAQVSASMLAFLLPLVAVPSIAGPPTREGVDRQNKVSGELKLALVREQTEKGKFRLISASFADEKDVNLRRRILNIAEDFPSPELEAFLISTLASDSDAGLRSLAATKLGSSGSEKCLGPLAMAAASDRTTSIRFGDVGGQSSARRAAIFAIAELAGRHPKLADAAAMKLRELPDDEDPKDNESLADARRQALYQVTQDGNLLKPLFTRLTSDDAKQRRDGVNAFQFLKLTKAPAEVVAALEDDDAEVRLTTAMVLGMIGDPETAEPLLAIAADAKAERGLRCNAIWSLGHMRAKTAGDLMEKLLEDEQVSANAAVALYRITGKKVKEFPEGYNAE